jgi:hypothetical protein
VTVRTTSWLFRGAAIYGLVLLLPLYFLETTVAAPASRLIAPEFFYGFVGAAGSFQLIYWMMGGDPMRYRPLMPVAVVAKLSFWIPVTILWAMGRTTTSTFVITCGDLILAIAFFAAWRSLRAASAI